MWSLGRVVSCESLPYRPPPLCAVHSKEIECQWNPSVLLLGARTGEYGPILPVTIAARNSPRFHHMNRLETLNVEPESQWHNPHKTGGVESSWYRWVFVNGIDTVHCWCVSSTERCRPCQGVPHYRWARSITSIEPYLHYIDAFLDALERAEEPEEEWP